ncbi:putative colanic acid biosynthesis UDP-glucose lipid carrier transferase [Kushneria sinocarnis]|uniref:Putative colanic acid biosynthesis UDP-glucose lipid carrier transferase n=1 Tax=Kushneria sinocarnis TaxID=595502 RepID=A0A420WWZ9_9GAMM|nr:undecaprenyl-phosphate glucose phosphotransferase [Kushneria sinocarnis]RKR04244.1 putative colanic acid biosynthesis UDP-glucose lipid carrier transferase [Kushneria sinocarnis]
MKRDTVNNISGFDGYANAFARMTDLLCILLAGFLAYIVRFGSVHDMTERYQWMMLSGALLGSIIFSSNGIYRSWRGSVRVMLVTLFARAYLMLVAVIAAYLFFTQTGEDFSRLWLGYWLAFSFLFCVGSRTIAYPFLNKIRKHGANRKKVMLVGHAESCLPAVARLKKVGSVGLDVVAVRVLDEKQSNYFKKIDCDIFDPERDSMAAVDEVWVCLPLSHGKQIEDVLNAFKTSFANIRYMPDLREFLLINHDVSTVAGMYLLDMSCSPMSGTARLIKEIEDKALTLLLLLPALPVMLLLALLIKLTSKGPVLYKQQRMGWNGHAFNMLKFRTMPPDAEKAGVIWGSAATKRMTPIGRFLRATSLDELPQLINVLRGDMSLVGPRPERVQFVERFKHEIPGYMQKHMVKAGMTGWAQVHGWRGDTSLSKRIEMDLWYIENWSFWLDMKIFFLTFWKGFVHRNAC